MFRSLRLRLLLVLSIIVILIVALVGYTFSRATTNEFQRFAERDFLDYERLVTPYILLKIENFLLFRRVDCDQSLANLLDCQSAPVAYSSESLTELEGLVKDLAEGTGTRIVVEDQEGRIIANSDWGQPENDSLLATGPETVSGFFIIEGDPYLVYINLSEETGLGASQLGFLSSVNRALIIAVASAVVAASFLTIMLSRRILRPLEEVMIGVRTIGKGELDYRVPIESNDEIGELAKAFNHMAGELSHLEHLRRQMVSDVAHELRTPLSNIRGYLEAIQDGLTRAEPKIIDSLHEEVLLLSRLVEDLQELALAEAGQLHLAPKTIDLKGILERTVLSLTPSMQAKSLTVHSDIQSNLPLVHADPERIGQVMRNLLHNAISYTPEGGRIKIRAYRRMDAVEVKVQDSGVGIAADQIPLVFERFYRVDPSRTRLTGGAGLGLAIVRQLIEAHGGEVGVESTPGVGSTFWFTLPLAAALTQHTRPRGQDDPVIDVIMHP